MKVSKARIQLDSFDMKILRTLGSRGFMKNIELADAVCLSESACFQRTAKLKKMGILKGFIADIDVSILQPHITVMTLLVLERQTEQEYRQLTNAIRRVPQIVRACRITGEFDYMIETVAPDFQTYKEIIEELIAGDFQIKQYQSRILQEEVKRVHPASAYLDYDG